MQTKPSNPIRSTKKHLKMSGVFLDDYPMIAMLMFTQGTWAEPNGFKAFAIDTKTKAY